MNISWDNIYLAMQIVVSAQLILGILVNLYEFKPRNILLAFHCYLIVYTYNIFFSYELNNTYLNSSLHIISSYIYFGPTLYLYLKSLVNEELPIKHIIAHYLLPFVLCVAYNIYPYKLYTLFIYVFLIVYVILSFGVYKKIIPIVKGNLKKRFSWFIGITLVYLCLDTPMIIIEDLSFFNISPFDEIYPSTNEFFYEYLHFPLLFFHFFILSLYTITEIPRFKKFFLTKTLKASGVSTVEQQTLKHNIESFFNDDKLFLNPDLSLEILSKKLNTEKSLVSKFLKETYNKGFNDFVNQYRIEAFKKHLSEKTYENYDLVSLAKETGFKSKATFYRVFKQLEGITPNQYKKQLDD